MPVQPSDTERSFDAADLEGLEAEEIPYLPLLGTPGYFVEKWVHILSAYPKTGKTELTMSAVEEWLRADRKVLWMTEESKTVWVERMRKRLSKSGRSFPRGCRVYVGLGCAPRDLLKTLTESPEPIVIVDTLRALLQPEDEADNSEMTRLLTPWVAAARSAEKTLIFLHHARKGGGSYGEGVSGAHAIVGMMDIILELVPFKGSRTRGTVKGRGKLFNPPDMIFTYNPETGAIIPEGSPEGLKLSNVEQQILDQIPAGACLKTGDIERLLQPQPSRDQVTRALQDLASKGQLRRDPAIGTPVQGKTVTWLKVLQGELPEFNV